MDLSIKFRKDEGLGLAAAVEAMRQLVPHVPVLTEISQASLDTTFCHATALFEDGRYTVDIGVLSLRWPPAGWVRVFPPGWRETGEFRQASLEFEGNSPDNLQAKLGTLIRVPLPEIAWEELPRNLREQTSRW